MRAGAAFRVLLVEDNPDDEALALRALGRSGLPIAVEVARDGAAAIDALASAAAAFDLVLLDLKLPKVDGLDVLRRVRSDPVAALLPVIVLTTSREPRDVADAYRLGANSYVRKPVDFEEFAAAILHLTHYWLRINQPAIPA